MPTIIRRNERSWAIELITEINKIVNKNDLKIKRAGGESTISTGRGNTMFPDVVLYGNREQSIILQGWELKMPDVPIEDETFIKDAQRKAIALNLNSCLIWNFTYAVLYIRNDDDTFRNVKQWDETNYIHTRNDVETYRSDWEKLLEKIILGINHYFVSGEFRKSSLDEVISNTTITSLVQRNKTLIADELKSSASRNAVLTAYINNWWSEVKTEYVNDETDKYNAYAKTVILNWSNRIVFAHIIKHRQNGAMLIDGINYNTTPVEANKIFEKITEKCDFYNVFNAINYNEVLPELSWMDFIEFSLFLKSNGIEHLEQSALQNILEGSVNTTKRQINGQYTTPSELARILVRLTMRDYRDNFLDCCCGTGTIPKAAIQIKKDLFTANEAVESVWACDKYQYPLQVANISMTDVDTINLANRIFQHNALNLNVGESIQVIDPQTGDLMELTIPLFGAVASNLPFVPFEIIPDDDKTIVSQIPLFETLNQRSDLYCYIATKISDVIKPNGLLGIITSNSWLGTKTGSKFVETLRQKYNILQVHISGKGRWFKNADVVTTIIILQKKGNNEDITRFFLWKKSLYDLAMNIENEDKLINSALLGKELDNTVTTMASYSQQQIAELLKLKVSYNSLFHKVDWLIETKNKAVPINKVYTVFRGSRRGWDSLFYPASGEHQIEPKYIKKVLKNARNITTLITDADSDAFCCDKSIEELNELNHFGSLEWINKFKSQRNGVGKPLPEVLKRANMYWYELKVNEIAEVFTMMNPDKRLFFAKFNTPSFVNQRLIGLKHKAEYDDLELNHALLNSIYTMFYIEASGFGRGLGVLDINKDSIANSYMLNPKLVSFEDRLKILHAFEKLKSREIRKTDEELCSSDRIEFERAVFKSFGIEEHYENIVNSLLSLQQARSAAKEI
ncbi:N-6 DNA methylase [Fannyhessea vaginae]|uniref:N-6 DNA methylase n=1 Tax=Fannyhessea vaginae TaxID=82135 RepID=UPI0023F2915A|nr:N-6 DNA methylase [Fannyhessea vaginae]